MGNITILEDGFYSYIVYGLGLEVSRLLETYFDLMLVYLLTFRNNK